MTEAGLSEFFPQRVAQSIQSITVEDIRDYFEHDVTGENGIPTGRFPMPATIDLAIATVVALRNKPIYQFWCSDWFFWFFLGFLVFFFVFFCFFLFFLVFFGFFWFFGMAF